MQSIRDKAQAVADLVKLELPLSAGIDLEVDRVNHPNRPLPSGRISVPELTILTFLFSAASFITSGLLGSLALALSVFI